MPFPARRLCQSVLAPAEANPALVRAEGRSQLSLALRKLCRVSRYFWLKSLGVIFRNFQPVAVQHQLPQEIWLWRSADLVSETNVRSEHASGEPSESSWQFATAWSQERVLDCSCFRARTMALSFTCEVHSSQPLAGWKHQTSYLEAGLASLKEFQCFFHVSEFASSHHQILLQQVEWLER